MFTKSLRTAMHGVIDELVTPQFERLSDRLDQHDLRFAQLDGKIEALGQRLDARIDNLDGRIDEVAHDLGSRIDELTAQQIRIVEQIGSLKTTVEVAATLERRIERLEDRFFEKSG